MSAVVRAASIALHRAGPVFDISLLAGEALAIMGPSGSGKSRLLKVLGGLAAPAVGSVEVASKAVCAEDLGSKRSTVQSLARPEANSEAGRATEALTATGLWNFRRHTLGKLSPGQANAALLLPPFVTRRPLIAIDGQLDLLDPWSFRASLDLIRKRLDEGSAAVIVTHRAEIAAQCHHLVVLEAGHAAYAGRSEDLPDLDPLRIEVKTNRQPATRALVERFKVGVSERDGMVVFEAPKGQEVAARLLTEGYGDVHLVAKKKRSFGDAVVRLLEPGRN